VRAPVERAVQRAEALLASSVWDGAAREEEEKEEKKKNE